MTELLPLSQARSLRENLGEFLTTTFSVSEPSTRQALNEFLDDSETGLFRGPYTRLRLPFAPSEDAWEHYVPTFHAALKEKGELSGPSAFQPYGHQVQAWKRLTTADGHQPEPTLVTTGTGSGKTEAFMVPVLDHCVRANAQGITGTKAIILYPMNALANDQAARLAEQISSTPEYEGVTAAIYTGEQKSKAQRTKVSAEGLINSQDVIRSDAPDILLTNYKMLDHLLLRDADAKIWQQSADSLTYLVLDEFHAYDGAQGTDVAMLLRRLGLTLKAQAGPLRSEDWDTPLGPVTPVATSATMGGEDDMEAMLGFASQVLGIQLGDDAIVTETRMTWPQWSAGALEYVESEPPGRRSLRTALRLGTFAPSVAKETLKDLEKAYGSQQSSGLSVGSDTGFDVDPGRTARIVLGHLYNYANESSGDAVDLSRWSYDDLLWLVKAHPKFESLQRAASEAADLAALVESVFGSDLALIKPDSFDPVTYVSVLLTTLSHLRAEPGRRALSVDVHVWVREVSRMDRVLSNDVTEFRWWDDGQPDSDGDATLPAIYCRSCGRTGWMAGLEPTGSDLDMDDVTIRRRAAASDPRVRALIHAKAEAEADEQAGGGISGAKDASYIWLLSEARSFERPDTTDPADQSVAGERIPVFVDLGVDGDAHSQDDVCPSCGARDSIRFLGSAAATLLSVSMTGLLGTPNLDERERKALVFTDSVQDAAHRAGFIQARSHALTLRTAIRECLPSRFAPSTNIAGEILTAADEKADSAEAKFALLPPQLEEDEAFEPFWKGTGGYTQNKATENMRRRLAFDVGLEFGLRSALGRTLENTGTATVRLEYYDEHLLAIAKRVVQSYMTAPLIETTDEALLRWVHGTLHHMRTSGAVTHRWYNKYRDSDGASWWLTGGRLRAEGMPGFGGRAGMPRFPISRSIRSKYPRLEPVPATTGWYGTWAGKALGADSSERGTLARELLEALAADGLVDTRKTESGAATYAIESDQIWVRSLGADEAESGSFALQCDLCGETSYADESLTKHLVGGPCLAARCAGTLHPLAVGPNFYQNLYRDSGLLKVVAREHTSLLPDEMRVRYEDEFKSPTPSPDAPNVLVATPTLEMGIDIGDLSAVMLSSLPKTVASYLQRVGRAGRLTGNSLTVAFVTARGDQLRLFQDPKTTINGEVLPPATFLRALEILKRQYIAAVADRLARDPEAFHPTSSRQAMQRGEGTYLDALAQVGAKPEVVEAFLSMFLTPGDQILPEKTKQALRDWVTPEDPDKPVGLENPSGLWRRFEEAALRWEKRVEELHWREQEIAKQLPTLKQTAESVAGTPDDKVAYRTALGSLRLVRKERSDLTIEYWVSTMEGAGLLPNYTLLDDSVTLGVTLSWIEPETQQWQEGDFDIARGSAQALRDFAPGATFYVRGMAIDVDAVDLGRGRDAVERWALCAKCGFVAELGVSLGEDEGDATSGTPSSSNSVSDSSVSGASASSALGPHTSTVGSAAGSTAHALDKPPASCPRCGDTGISDAAQQLHVVKLDRVSAVMRRDNAQISDTMAERREAWFEVVTAADMDPSHTASWYVEGEDFGVRHSTSLTMRWLNMGKRMGGGETHVISGHERQGPQFRVCSYCGQEDITPDANNPKEHRPWCPRRNDLQSSTIKLSLARKLEGEGLLIRVPQAMTVGDTHSMASLMAAVHMALEMQLGRADHLAVTEGRDPSGEGVGNGILIYDEVPGGTGYLGELAALSEDGKPHSLWQILKNAYDRLNTCECVDGDLLACEKCLLPYAPRSQQGSVSRQVAARLLGELLVLGQTKATSEDSPEEREQAEGSKPDAVSPFEDLFEAARQDPWPNRTSIPPSGFTIETFLEGAFRETVSATFDEHGWNVKALPATDGDALVLAKDRLRWRMEPQVLIGPTKPDFLLTAADRNVSATAVYTDGRQNHFAPRQFNRVGDDSTKRDYLRDHGHRVLAVTARDVERAQEALRSGAPDLVWPKWFSRQAAEMLIEENIGGLSAQSFTILAMNAVDLMRHYMSSPGARQQAKEVAEWLPLMFVANLGRAEVSIGPGESLLQVTAEHLADKLRVGGGCGGGGAGSSTGTSAATSDGASGETSGGASDRVSDGAATDSPAAASKPGAPAYVWVDGTLAVGVRQLPVPGSPLGSFEVVALLDDSAENVGPGTEESWRSWLHISNLLDGRDAPTIITTTSRMRDDHGRKFLQAFVGPPPSQTGTSDQQDIVEPPSTVEPASAAESTEAAEDKTEVDEAVYARWQALVEEAYGVEEDEEALNALASQAPELPLPEVGKTEPSGIPVPIGWARRKVALSVGLSDEYRGNLEDSGWLIVGLDVEAIWNALKDRGL